jgi:adenylate cyclase
MAVAVPRHAALRVVVWAFHLALPPLGLWLLLAQPQLDARWRHQAVTSRW